MDMTHARRVGYGIGGFALSLATVLLTTAGLQLLVTAVWTPPQSILIAYTTPCIVAITALATTWIGLLKVLKNKAIIRGVWCQIYAVVGFAIIGLLVVLFL